MLCKTGTNSVSETSLATLGVHFVFLLVAKLNEEVTQIWNQVAKTGTRTACSTSDSSTCEAQDLQGDVSVLELGLFPPCS